ncbi:MAG: NAD-dependent epimerase/dehydratase family protein [Saprospiraceae bacterium]|nr:NAD-dependent epimerase/dehydratase family protein [Saprospiraceae bacterium]
MKIIITGADGFVGSNLVRELLLRGHSLVAFVEEGRATPTLEGLPIEKRYGNLLDPASLRSAMRGCEALIHVAAVITIWPYRSSIQQRVNIEGTRHAMEAALAEGLKRVVHVGTANSFGFGTKADPGNETRPYEGYKYGLDYMDTKYAAQQLVLAMVKEKGLPALVVNPAFMIGPFASPKGTGLIIEAVYRNKIKGYTRGGRCYVSVKDVCVAIANALEMGTIGECYILGNENLNYQEIFTAIAEVTGGKPPTFRLPVFLVKSYCRFATVWARLTGKQPLVSYPMGLMSLDNHYYSPAKARQELQLPQTPIKTAIQEAFDWMKEYDAFSSPK